MTYTEMILRIRFLIDAANTQRFEDSRISDAINIATDNLMGILTRGLVYGEMNESNSKIIDKLNNLYLRDQYVPAILAENQIDVSLPYNLYALHGMRIKTQTNQSVYNRSYEVKAGILSRFDDMVLKDPYTSINANPENLYQFPHYRSVGNIEYHRRIYNALYLTNISGSVNFEPNVVANRVFIDYIVKPNPHGVTYNMPELLREEVCKIAAELLKQISLGDMQK